MRPLPTAAEARALRTHAAALDSLRAEVKARLAAGHLVDVAAALHARGHTPEDMGAIGLPADVLAWFPAWREGRRDGFAPPRSGLTLVPAAAAAPLGTLRLQLSPRAGTVPLALHLTSALLRRTDARVVVAVEPGADLQALHAILGGAIVGEPGRVDLVALPTVSVFARDNGQAARDADGAPVLLIPRAFGGLARTGDAIDPDEGARAFGVPVRRSALHWDGGNLLYDGEHLLLGVDTVRENTGRLGLTDAEVVAAFAAELGHPVTLLGDLDGATFDAARGVLATSGQADFHVDLDVALLGRYGRNRRPRALVADPARGLLRLPQVLSQSSLFRGHFLPPGRARAHIEALWDDHARARHPMLLGYAATLERLGYRVVGVPDLRLPEAENVFRPANLDFGYCNVLAGRHDGAPAVYWLPWGVPALDADAEACFREAGLVSVRVTERTRVSNALMALCGGLHCFCGGLPPGT